MGRDHTDVQLMINMSLSFANEERYLLQPTKTVALNIKPSKRTTIPKSECFKLGEINLNHVDTSVHLGITRTTSVCETAEVNVEGNISKARRALYSLLGAGLHGHNGLDHKSMLDLYKSFVLPVLTYGIEIFTPKSTLIKQLDLFQRKTIKQILSLPNNAADPCVLILTGLLPIEAIYHLKILNFFNNICGQNESSIERQIVVRQLSVKSGKSSSWINCVLPLLVKYDLGDVDDYLQNPLNKSQWRLKVHKTVVNYWTEYIDRIARTYSSLKYMNIQYSPGKFHPLIQAGCSSALEVTRLPTRFRLLTGTYVLQVNRCRFNQYAISAVCPNCKVEDETVEHFLLRCSALEQVRAPVMCEIWNILESMDLTKQITSPALLAQTVIDWSIIVPNHPSYRDKTCMLEFHIRRLFFHLHTTRYRLYKELSGN